MNREGVRSLPRHAVGVTAKQDARSRGERGQPIEIVRANVERAGPDCDLIFGKIDDHTLDDHIGLLCVCGLLRDGGVARRRKEIFLQGRKEEWLRRSHERLVRAVAPSNVIAVCV